MATTARPTRTRRATATKATPAKVAPKAAQVEPEAAAEVAEVEAYVITLEEHPDGATKSYTRFVPPKSSGCVGTLYLPLGTVSARVKIEGPSA